MPGCSPFPPESRSAHIEFECRGNIVKSLKTRFLFLLFIAGLILALSTALPILAQDASTQVTYGTPVQGTIDQTTHSQNWSLQTASADRITVTVQRMSGNLIPQINIL